MEWKWEIGNEIGDSEWDLGGSERLGEVVGVGLGWGWTRSSV